MLIKATYSFNWTFLMDMYEEFDFFFEPQEEFYKHWQ